MLPMTESAVWVPMRDRLRLAGSLYRPPGTEPVPALIEALPYRKDDVTRSDAAWYRRLRDEGHFAVLRVDVRGTGSSDGVAVDEYPPSEVDDLASVIAWCADQPWCTGRVGMFGTSYSGFNALHAAVAAPPQLDAVCALFASDDRYSDDVHYGGGALRALDLLDYPLYMTALNALPPVPTLAGSGWRRAWAARCAALEPWVLRWLAEPSDGPYWRRGSVRPRTGRIRCATMLIAGWADGYRNATFRVFEQLRGPRKLLIGPWSHQSPDDARPGPCVDVVPELIRWFDRHLRDRGPDREPPITVFVRQPSRPAADLDRLEGGFWREREWPPRRGSTLILGGERATGPSGPAALRLRGPAGVTSSIWCAGALPFGQAWDQRDDEVLSRVWDWPVVDRPVTLLGSPLLQMELASATATRATVAVRLTDVFPDGMTELVARGLGRVDGPGREVVIELDAAAFTFPPGHRIRLTLAAGDWPSVWPPPDSGPLPVQPAGLRLSLPVVPGPDPTMADPVLRLADATCGGGAAGRRVVWRVEDDRLCGERRVVIDHGSHTRLGGEGWVTERYAGAVGSSWLDPAQAWASGWAAYGLRLPGVTCSTRADLDVRTSREQLRVELRLRWRERGGVGGERRWSRRYPRFA